MDREEGEMSDDREMFAEEMTSPEPVPQSNSTVLYRAEKNGLVVQKLERIDASKIEERARRFGLNLTGNRVVTQKQIDDLYENCGIESGNERHFRFDAIHLNGVNGLSTRDIFEYLEDYKPVSLEWLDDVSCNVVCQDHITAALALLVHSREIKNNELKDMLAEKSPHHWREGMPHPKKDLILMRFATNGDKKMTKKKFEAKGSDSYYDHSMESIHKNPWGDLCKSWGVYDHQEVFQRKLPKHDYEDDIEQPDKPVQIKNKNLAMRLGKRTHKEVGDSDDNSSDSEWKKKSKTPRMRMHADDEESKIKRKQVAPLSREPSVERETYAPLSIEVINHKINYVPRKSLKLSDKFKNLITSRNLQSRLGNKIPPEEQELSDNTSSGSSDHNIMSRVEKVSNRNRHNSSVWSRLETKQKDTGTHNDLRHILKSKKHKKPEDMRKTDDLRGRIGKSKQSNLRIEIDNN